MAEWRELTFPADSSKDIELVIEDERAKVITDPLRWRILEILGEGKTVTEISEALNVTDARVLYHAQRLAQTGVVVLEDGTAASSREWRCLPAAGAIRVREEQKERNRIDTAGQMTGAGAAEKGLESSNNQVSEAIPAEAAGQFNQAFREAAEGMYGSSFQSSVNHNRARLSGEQAAEFNRRLLALVEEYFPPGKGDQAGIKYGFYGVFTPIDLHPLVDSEDAGKEDHC